MQDAKYSTGASIQTTECANYSIEARKQPTHDANYSTGAFIKLLTMLITPPEPLYKLLRSLITLLEPK